MRFNPSHRSFSLPSCAVAGLLFLAGSTPGQALQKDTQKPSKKPTVSRSSASSQRATSSRPSSSSRNRDLQSMQNRSKPGGESRATTSTSGSSHTERRGSRSTRSASGSRGRHYDRGRHSDRGRHRSYRRHRSHHGYGGYYGYHRYPYYRSHYYYYPRASFYWYGSYYPFYYGYRPAYGGDGYRSHYNSGGAVGALDLDVKPEEAEIYVNGRYAGIADNFDGFPAYLWLEEGNYEISFYKEGYETITRQFSVTPEAVIDVRDQMVSGQAVLPEAPPEAEPAQASDALGGREDEWRQRAREYRNKADSQRAPMEPPSGGAYDARQEPGRLLLSIEPRDASVYLDGRFLGTAEDLARLHSGLILDPGRHELQVLRPGFTAESRTFEVDPGEELDLDVRLEANKGDI